MANKIILKKTSTASKVPLSTDLEVGEIAVNLADQKLYSKNAGGTVILVGSGGGGTGDVVGPASATDNALARFDTTTGKLIQNSVVTVSDTGAISGAESISNIDFAQFDTTATPTIAMGKQRWNVDTNTLAFGIIDGTREVQIGQQMYAQVVNAEAVTITKGQAVYLFQATGSRASVKLANNTGDETSAKTLGLVVEDITAGSIGFVITQGVLDKLNTSAYTEGATLYLGATAGSLTATKPKAPNHLVYIGVVERTNAGNGQIYVRTQNGYELDEIHDVQINSPANGQTIVYDASTSLWKNANITGGTGISVTNGAGSITLANTGVTSFSAGTTGLTPSTGTTGAVTLAGTLAIANGGTGATTRQNAMDALAGAVTSGQYLRGNGTDVVMSAIQAGDVPTLNQNTTGSAATLTTGRTIAITGDLTYTSPSFNGSANVTAAGTLATVNANVGTYGSSTAIPVVTVNAKGLVTAVSTATVAGGQYFGSAAVKAIAYNANTIGENVTVTAGNNGLSAGPITISTGFTVTVETGANWVIV
jgi:hypothetical protein